MASPSKQSPEVQQAIAELTAPDLGDHALTNSITEGMRHAETLLRAELSHGEDFIVDKINHLVSAGGKRFRVVFTLLASQYGTEPLNEDVIRSAVVVEMIHLATLYHDDVMDESDRRRGAESANARWGNSVAILAGDYLFSTASRLLADLGSETTRHFADTFQELVTGQMRETVGCPEGGSEVDHYMTVIQEKTGVLIASAGFLGSLHSGAPREYVEALYRFGRHMGQVFQIVDDVIDIWSAAEESGKVPGTDLREGVFTLPVLYALQQSDATGQRLREILVGPVTDDALVDEALGLIRASSGREKAEADVQRYCDLAEKELAILPASATTEALRRLMHFALKRLG